jgi:hypothetical protein
MAQNSARPISLYRCLVAGLLPQRLSSQKNRDWADPLCSAEYRPFETDNEVGRRGRRRRRRETDSGNEKKVASAVQRIEFGGRESEFEPASVYVRAAAGRAFGDPRLRGTSDFEPRKIELRGPQVESGSKLGKADWRHWLRRRPYTYSQLTAAYGPAHCDEVGEHDESHAEKHFRGNGGSKASEQVDGIRRQCERQTQVVVWAYSDEVMERIGAGPGVLWQPSMMTRAIPWGNMPSLHRIQFHLSLILAAPLRGNHSQAGAYTVQLLRALPKVAASGGIWFKASELPPVDDPLYTNPGRYTQEELDIMQAYQEAVKKLVSKPDHPDHAGKGKNKEKGGNR